MQNPPLGNDDDDNSNDTGHKEDDEDEDVRPENIIIQKKRGAYSAVVLDFAQARIRRKDECNQEWKENKWMQDEEGAVGYVMGRELSLEFEQSQAGSLRYYILAADMKFYLGSLSTAIQS